MRSWKRGATPAAGPRRAAVTATAPADVAWRRVQVSEPLAGTVPGPVVAGWDADGAVTALYAMHYRSLVRLAELLVGDLATAEDVVQESFVAMHGRWHRLRDYQRALSYLRKSVIDLSRWALWHRIVVDRNTPAADVPSTRLGTTSLSERSTVFAALGTLPPRQREALVLRYYGDLPEAQIAAAMGISTRAARRYTAQARSALCALLESPEA